MKKFNFIVGLFTIASAIFGGITFFQDSNATNDSIKFSPESKAIGYNLPSNIALANYDSTQNEFDTNKKIVLIPPFENVTGIRSEITIDAPTDSSQNTKIKTRVVDRYTEAPRAILEDILLQFPKVIVVERQQLDKMLLESEYGRKSGLVDSKFAIEIGKQLGANSIVTGTIINIREKNNSFKGYGITTNTKTITSTIRVRVIDISSGRIVYSKLIENSIPYNNSNFGGIRNSDTAFEVMNSSLNKLRKDNQFTRFFDQKLRKF
jgi:curli biogenesis system outer membrane secretion channel CsgG